MNDELSPIARLVSENSVGQPVEKPVFSTPEDVEEFIHRAEKAIAPQRELQRQAHLISRLAARSIILD